MIRFHGEIIIDYIIDLHHCIAMIGNVKGKIVEVACIIAWVKENYLPKV
jgi:hypothetical protein